MLAALHLYPKSERRAVAQEWARRSQRAQSAARLTRGQAELPLDGENVSPFTQAQNLARG